MARSSSANGDLAEAFVAEELRARGYQVVNLNHLNRNYPHVDLRVTSAAARFDVSVKSCWSSNRQLRLGAPHILAQLPDEAFMVLVMPPEKGMELRLEPSGYELWVVPGAIAREEALAAHYHYAAHSPGSAGHSVMVKDKVDRSAATRSGALFQSWRARFRDGWSLLPR